MDNNDPLAMFLDDYCSLSYIYIYIYKTSMSADKTMTVTDF